jgi:hypothetical protein
MRLAILTTKTTHHAFFAQEINKINDNVDIFIEKKKVFKKFKIDDSIEKNNEFVIYTDGTNLEEIFQNSYIDPYLSQSDSVLEIIDDIFDEYNSIRLSKEIFLS